MSARVWRRSRSRPWLAALLSSARTHSLSLIWVAVAGAGCRSADSRHDAVEVLPADSEKATISGRVRGSPDAHSLPVARAPAPPVLPEQQGQSNPIVSRVALASEDLPSEDGEHEPASETVTIAVQVEPPKQAHVFWGAKDFGVAPLEIKRPRGSGPLDLILRAPGFLALHTRAFTDHNDRIAVRLVPETEAPRMLGYRSR